MIKLSELTREIESVIRGSFFGKSFLVLAETSTVKYYQDTNRYYFDLIEKDEVTDVLVTKINACAFGAASIRNIREFEQATGQRFESNIQVLMRVKVDYTRLYGLQVQFQEIDKTFTLGNLEKKRQDTLTLLTEKYPHFIRLVNGRYESFNQRLNINVVIQRIALITSEYADGYADFKTVLETNQYGYKFEVQEFFTRVQGAGASEGMKQKFIEIFESKMPYDVIVIVRGGGSGTDFMAFDSYDISRAVAKFPIPVFTGIGHTPNLTITDMMAYKASVAPTKVAEEIIAHNRRFEESILALQETIINKTTAVLSENNLFLSQVRGLINSKSLSLLHEKVLLLSDLKASLKLSTKETISYSWQSLSDYVIQLKSSALGIIEKEKQRHKNYTQLVRHLSPESVLKRGYALVYQNGKLVTDPKKIDKGSEMSTLLAGTEIISTVKDKKKYNERRTEL